MEENTNLPAKTEKKKHAGGRPTRYRKRFCLEIFEFFDVKPCREVETKIVNKDGSVTTITTEVANDLPFLSAFARKIGVVTNTLDNWADKHPEFLRALTTAKDMYQEMLLTNGLHGRYNSSFAKFVATATTELRDQKDVLIDAHVRKYGVIVRPEILEIEEGKDYTYLLGGDKAELPEGSTEKH
jgi:hypothetical protein